MTLEENKKLVLDHYRAFLRRDAEAIRKQLAADFVDHEAPPGTPAGPEATVQGREMLRQAFPDLSVTIEDIVAEGDRVAVRGTWKHTHTGFFAPMNLPPTNRTAIVTGMVFWRIRDGQLVERWANLDRLSLQQQLTGSTAQAGGVLGLKPS
jgi:predicted ester cyclase